MTLTPEARRARLLGQQTRADILRALASKPSMSFRELRIACHLTDGNLSQHAQKLERAGVISCEKGYRGRIPLTLYRLTEAGRAEFYMFQAGR